MPELASPRFDLPLLAVAQAQKEITHNEALILIDALLHPVAEGVNAEPPSLVTEDAGKCWIIGADATGIWVGRDDALACWTGSGWRYIAPVVGMAVIDRSDGVRFLWSGSDWQRAISIDAPMGGTTIDVEARNALSILLENLRVVGLLA